MGLYVGFNWAWSAFFGGGSGGGAGNGNVTVVCPAILRGMFETDKKTYKLGEDATVRGQFSAKRGDENYNMPVEVTYTSPSGKEYGPNNVWPEYSGGDCGFLNFHFTIETVAEPGTWKMSAVYPRLNLNMDTQFKVVAVAEQPYPETWINWVRAKPTGLTTYHMVEVLHQVQSS
jgi:hypothetical protein